MQLIIFYKRPIWHYGDNYLASWTKFDEPFLADFFGQAFDEKVGILFYYESVSEKFFPVILDDHITGLFLPVIFLKFRRRIF
jgi:hypothetical protein